MPVESNPLVSVGVTSYQRPEGLKKVLNGLLGQTYKNLEIVVSDNCSSMVEIEKVLEYFTNQDKRIRVFRQAVNIGMEPNHTFVARKATGDYFLWLHDDDDIPQNYIERCVERFSDSSQIELVGPRADAHLEGRYWYTYRNYSNLGQSVYVRLRTLIAIGYSEPSGFQQYFYGVFRRKTLMDCIWVDGKYYYKETFSLFFRLSERGFIHFADDVKLDKYNFNEDFKKWRDANYVDKPLRYKFAGAKVEELLPRTVNILSTVARSSNLGRADKVRLMTFCLTRFAAALASGRAPLWKRIALLPFRLLRKIVHLTARALDKVL